jgi:hypothetical protein
MATMTKKGKRIFTVAEVTAIERLLVQLRQARFDQQKDIRKFLRIRKFYISDYSASPKGFTVNDFRELIRQQEIIIE